MPDIHRPLPAELSRLPLWFPVLLACGIGLYFAGDGPQALLPYAAALAVVLATLVFGRKTRLTLYPLAAALALLLGVMAAGLRLHMVEAPVLSEPVFFKPVEGVVADIQHKEKKTRLILENPVVEGLAPENTPEKVSITIKSPEASVAIGDRVRLPAMLFPPPAPAMPGAYDFARMYYFEQLGAVGFSPRAPEVLAANPNKDSITALRLSIADHLVSAMGPQAGAIAAAMMVGDQSRVPEAMSDSMRASGIYHILSISGLHMALAVGMIFVTLRLVLAAIPHTALFWPTKKIAAVGGLLGGAAYLLLAGSPVPAVRSYIMVACVMCAILVDRKGISMTSLAWAATLILLFFPESLFSASFQLSFAATLAIVALYERHGALLFHAHAGVIGRTGLYFLGLALTSLVATLATTPLAIAHFNRMSVYGIATNMLIVPLSSFLIMPSAMLAFLTMPFAWDAPFLALLAWALEWMMRVSDWVATIPYATLALPSPSAAGFIAMVLGGLWYVLFVSSLRWLGMIAVAAGLSTIAAFVPYDMLVSADAKRIAYRSAAGQWVMLRGDVDSYEAELWLRSQGATSMLSRAEAKKTLSEVSCDAATCMIERDKTMLVVVLRKGAQRLCDSGADVVITDRYLACADVPILIDRDFVATHGATGLRFHDGMIELTTSEHIRGHWPWTERETNDDRNDE